MRYRLAAVAATIAIAVASLVGCHTDSTPAPQQAPGAMAVPAAVIKTAEALLPGMAVSYTAINWHTANGCIDDGQNLVRSWPCNGTEPQAFWGVDTIKGNGSYLIAENGKHCLDAPSSKNWSDLVDGPCSLHYFRERWYFDYGPTGNFILRNQVSGKCLQDGNDQPYVRMSVYTCNGSRSQQVWPYYSGKFQ